MRSIVFASLAALMKDNIESKSSPSTITNTSIGKNLSEILYNSSTNFHTGEVEATPSPDNIIRSEHSMRKNYYQTIKNEYSKLTQKNNSLYICNAGIMNHGKSSLLNSLLDQEVFSVRDIRETVVNKEHQWKNNITFIDTPGLSATNQDNSEAYNAYKKSNAIIFVHTSKIGELHKNELEEINTICSMYPSAEYFWNHFCLVLTFRDEADDHAMELIKNESMMSIKKYCNPTQDFPIFSVSNRRYQKGISENKQGLINKSGIPELREYILAQAPIWNKDNENLQNLRIKAYLINMENKLNKEYQTLSSKYKQQLNKIQAQINSKRNTVKELFRAYTQAKNRVAELKRNLNNIWIF